MLKCSGKVSAGYSNCLIPASEKIVIKMSRRWIEECGKEHGIPGIWRHQYSQWHWILWASFLLPSQLFWAWKALQILCIHSCRPQRWSIFQGDGMVNAFFLSPPLPSMVFQWFWQRWTITIECFWGGPTIETNGFSMVFKILRAMVNNGLFYPLWSIFSPLWSIFNLI